MNLRIWHLAPAGGAAALAALLALGGCADNPAGTGGIQPPAEATIDLAQDWGGLTASDEPANFGEPEFTTLAAGQTAMADPMANDARVRAIDNQPGRTVIWLRVVWGNLARNSLDSTAVLPATTWDGHLVTTVGGLVVQNVIRFEKGDHLIRPRTDPRTVGWVSKTHGGVDGLLLKVVYDPGAATQTDQLTFATSPLTVSFPILALAGLDTMIAAGGQGNGVAITAVPDDRRADCPAGTLEGLWRRNLEDGGTFRSVLYTNNGFLEGFMRGRFGVRKDGSQVFVGKVIAPKGHFKGFVRGTFTVDLTGASGEFDGSWFGRDKQARLGTIDGHWASRQNGANGFLGGRWGILCAEPSIIN